MSSGVDSPSQSTSSALNGAQSDSPLTAALKLSYTQSLRRAIVKKFNTLRGHSAPSPLEEGSVEAPAKAAHATVPKKLKKGASPPSVINVFRQSVVCELCTNISASGVKDIYCSDKCAKRAQVRETRMLDTTGYNGAVLIKTENPEFRKMHSRVRWGRSGQVEDLLNAGCPVNLADEHGNTALIVAVQNDQVELVKLLVKRGADVNHQNLTGNTALHFAHTYGHKEIFDLLIASNADASIKNADGVIPSEYEKAGKVE